MAVAFNRGQQLTEKDLYINIRNVSNQLFDPFSIRYNIFDTSSGTEILVPPLDRNPIRVSTGFYYANELVPVDFNLGPYKIVWEIQDVEAATPQYPEMSFQVVGLNVTTTEPELTGSLRDLVLDLRVLLRDNNPDRNYHFRPPTDKDIIRGYTEKFSYVWETSELITYLKIAADWASAYPPRQNITIPDGIPVGFYHLILQRAQYYAANALSFLWVQEEFGYSIQSISLDIDRASKYQGMADTLEAQTKEILQEVKSGLKFTRGLVQQKFSIGAQGVLGPYTGGLNIRNWFR